MIKEREDYSYLFLNKRITCFMSNIPSKWGDGYDNVYACCTIEEQRSADERLPVFTSIHIKHRDITAQPLVERVGIN